VVQRWAMDWMIGGSSPGRSWEFFSSPPDPDLLWDPSNLLSKGTRDSFVGGKAARGVKLTTHFHPLPRSRMRGAILPLPNTPSWRGAQLRKVRLQLLWHYNRTRINYKERMHRAILLLTHTSSWRYMVKNSDNFTFLTFSMLATI
jgi:hypothetical protein